MFLQYYLAFSHLALVTVSQTDFFLLKPVIPIQHVEIKLN